MKARDMKQQLGTGVLKPSMSKLLAIYKVQVSAKQGDMAKESIVLEDPGSTNNLITHQLVRDLAWPANKSPSWVRCLKDSMNYT